MKSFVLSCLLAAAFAQGNGRKRSVEEMVVEVVKEEDNSLMEAAQKPESGNFLSMLIGEDAQARVVESITTWATDKAKENPGCVERFICETYRTGETLTGLPYLFMSLTNAAVSFMLAEQFGDAVEMGAITRAARYGRMTGTCHRMECPMLDGQLRTVTDYLSGFEEMLGYIVNSVSTSLG